MQTYEGQLQAQGLKITIIAARFNQLITQSLVDGAINCIVRNGGSEQDISVVWVPGAYELSFAAHQVGQTLRPDAIICLGAVIRGATAHFDYVAGAAANGIGQASISLQLPVIFGVLTTDTIEQAFERAGTKAGNKGWDAAMSAIEMANLVRKLKG